MGRVLLAVFFLCAGSAAWAADDIKVLQLEQDVRSLQRNVQSMSRQLDELRAQLTRAGEQPKALPSSPALPASSGTWLDATKWQRLKTGMSELEVISSLGPPTSMRGDKAERLLLYAMEIGSSGFLGGSVRLREGRVIEVQKPVLQ